MAGAKLDDELLIEATAEKLGKKMVFLKCELRDKESNRIICTGTHTKFNIEMQID